MKFFLNIIAVMLLVTWVVAFFVLTIGNIAHAILIMAILVVFCKFNKGAILQQVIFPELLQTENIIEKTAHSTINNYGSSSSCCCCFKIRIKN